MAAIPVELSEEQFNTHIKPHLSTAKRGYESKQPLFQIFNLVLHTLHTGGQWEETPVPRDPEGVPLMSWQVPRYHFYKWSKDGSLERLFQAGVLKIKYELNLSILNFDGSHSAAKKGAKKLPIKDERRQKPVTSFR